MELLVTATLPLHKVARSLQEKDAFSGTTEVQPVSNLIHKVGLTEKKKFQVFGEKNSFTLGGVLDKN